MCATKRTVGINEPPQGSSFAGSAKEPVSRWSVAMPEIRHGERAAPERYW